MEKLDWQKFLDSLTKICKLDGVLPSFKKLSTDEDRLNFCIDHKLIIAKLSDWMYNNPCGFDVCQKDTEIALKCKTEGNRYYVRKIDDKALDYYNKGLLHATQSDLGLLYGNRSALLYKKELWRECATDIDEAILNDFPGDKIWKLYKRKGEALLKLQQYKESKLSFQKVLLLLKEREVTKEKEEVQKFIVEIELKEKEDKIVELSDENVQLYEPVNGYNNLITCGSAALTLCTDNKQGRFLVASENIKAGSIIISEKPYAAVLLPPWYLSHCHNCFVKINVLFPCTQCTKICYCSRECQSESWEKYHYFECGKLDLMERIGIAHLALRVILVTDVNELVLVAEKEHNTSDIIDGCNDKGIYSSNYESVYSLLPHSENLQVEDLFQYTVAGTLLYKVLINNHFFKDETPNNKISIGGLLIRHIQQLICNAHAITCLHTSSGLSTNIVEQDQVRIATAIYPTTSLLNHSCEPTILNSFSKDRLIVKVVKDVEKNDQIFNCYGPHYRRMSFAERQKVLKQQYFFTCQCKHCLHGVSAAAEMNCFVCEACQNALIQDGGTSCDHCGAQISKFDDFKIKSEQATKLFQSGLKILQSQQNAKTVNNVLQIFEKCLNIQTKIYFKNHSLLAKTYDVIAKCYAMIFKYAESLKYLEKSLKIVEVHFGEKSVEVMNEILKISDIYMEQLQVCINEKNYDGIRLYLPGASKTMERCISLVEMNKQPDSEELKDLKLKHEGLHNLRFIPGM